MLRVHCSCYNRIHAKCSVAEYSSQYNFQPRLAIATAVLYYIICCSSSKEFGREQIDQCRKNCFHSKNENLPKTCQIIVKRGKGPTNQNLVCFVPIYINLCLIIYKFCHEIIWIYVLYLSNLKEVQTKYVKSFIQVPTFDSKKKTQT